MAAKFLHGVETVITDRTPSTCIFENCRNCGSNEREIIRDSEVCRHCGTVFRNGAAPRIIVTDVRPPENITIHEDKTDMRIALMWCGVALLGIIGAAILNSLL